MNGRRRLILLGTALLALPAAATGQGPYGAAPPIPTGPPLELPPAAATQPTWVEGGSGVVPAGGIMAGPPGTPAILTDVPWPTAGVHSESACNFDAPVPGPTWMLADPSSIQVLIGSYFSGRLGPRIPDFNYVPVTVRHAWNVGNPVNFTAGLPGDWEVLAGVTGAGITSAYGNYFAGGTLGLRYNWAPRGSPMVPYWQGGVGGIYNDAYQDQSQRAIGQAFEFFLHAEVGLRWTIAPNLSLDVEGGLQHISNGGMASRNLGANSFGGSIGFTYYFPWGAPASPQ